MKSLILLGTAAAPFALSHEGERLKPHDLWKAWGFDPGIVLPLLLAAVVYFRGATPTQGITEKQKLYFWAGWPLLCVALLSPLHPLGESLFSAHMAQHELLMVVVAPLLVLARPSVAFLWGLPLAWRRDLVRFGCGSCQTIPGIVGTHGKVGSSLADIVSHSYIAGLLPNQPPSLERWIQHPHSVQPDSLMPELGLTDAPSRDIAAYLYSPN
jgi:cytochrome c oxidase assembly factor CtaG